MCRPYEVLQVADKLNGRRGPYMKVQEHAAEIEARFLRDRHVALDRRPVVLAPHVDVVD